MIFLKLGGSLLTDKKGVEAVRADVLGRVADEIAAFWSPERPLLLSHGSGSFGHVAAARHGTRAGVATPAQWLGFAEVAAAAARLNRLVVEALLAVGLPAVSFAPSTTARCEDGRLAHLDADAVAGALANGLLPVVYGDVALDTVRGGTIVSTEEALAYLVGPLAPRWLLLAGETAGVLDSTGAVVPAITRDSLEALAGALGGSRGTDVTGGMATKVQAMLDLVDANPALSVLIFSGLDTGAIGAALRDPAGAAGTLIQLAVVAEAGAL